MKNIQDKLMKIALLACSLMVLFLLVTAAYKENFGSDWYRYQSEYKRALITKATTDRERLAAERFDVGQKQLYLPDLNRIDRCVTCHVAIDNPSMADAAQPLKTHSGDIMDNHPKEQFGCTICHRGQGRATTEEDAHGHVEHWPKPVLASDEMDQACPKCHTDQSLPNVARYNAAMDLFYEIGCLTCHKLRSRGGDIGPDITNAGVLHDAEWHFKHFKDPKSVVSTSEMPNEDLSDEQAKLLTYLVMCYKDESIPTKLLSNPKQSTAMKLPEPLDKLALVGFVGSKFCISCHGATHPEMVETWRESKMASTYERIRYEPVKDNCLPCHTTGLNSETGHFSEEGVGCEACHGPGREAVRAVLSGDTKQHKELIQIDKDSKPICERCHNPHISIANHAEFYRKLPTQAIQRATIEPAAEEKISVAKQSSINIEEDLKILPDIKREDIDTIKTIIEKEQTDENKPITQEGHPETTEPEISPAQEHQVLETNLVTKKEPTVTLEKEENQLPVSPKPDIAKSELNSEAGEMTEKETNPTTFSYSPSLNTGESVVPPVTSMKPVHKSPDVTLPRALAMTELNVISGSSVDAAPTKIEGGCVSSECHSSTVFGEFVHGPTAQQDCDPCHRLVDEPGHKFELTTEEPDLCFQCHDPPEKAEHQHGPVSLGVCTVCHNPHSGPYKFMLPETGNNLCFTCHTEKQEHVESVSIQHEVISEEGCIRCHDPHRSNFKYQLKADMPGLCLDCHEPIRELAENSTVRHEALTRDEKCANCHEPHGNNVPGMLVEQEINLCLNCHDEPMDTPNGRIIDMKSWIENNPERHGPIRDGNCTLCHQPHGSEHFRLLSYEFPREFYMPFSIEIYDLCFQCHENTLVLDERTTVLTDFRNGDKNLHYVHVNQKKGRTCRACHEVHAGTKPKRIKDFVPFGTWMYPVNFELTPNGGKCAPGCHLPRAYDRKEAIEQK